MKKISFLLTVTLLCSAAMAQPLRKQFAYEQREGDTRPKPNLQPNLVGTQRVVSNDRVSLQNKNAKGGWVSNGFCICDTASSALPYIVTDGKSGAIITWSEAYRGWPDDTTRTLQDIYAQRVDSGGNIIWQSQGVPVCSLKSTDAAYEKIVADGYGGAIIAWEEYGRIPDGYTHVYAQRLDSMGNRLWPENGVLVCSQPSGYVDLCSDGYGGAIIVYSDGRNEATTSDDIYAQRIDSAGNAVWAADGVPVCVAADIQFWPGICSNNNGGATITWWDDYRNGSSEMDAYGQLINGAGDIKWTINGELLCSKTGNQKSYDPVANNCGGALIGWADYTTPYTYMQSIDSFGVKQWSDTGIVVGRYGKFHMDGRGGGIGSNQDTVNRIDSAGKICWGSGIPLHNTLPSGGENDADADGFGGVVAIWNYSTHLFAQRVDSSGVVLWNTTGVPVCTTMNTNNYQHVVGDMLGGAIATWYGLRWKPYYNIWVHRIYPDGDGVTGSPEEELLSKPTQVKVFPNPFKNAISISYTLNEPGLIKINIYSISGQLIKTLFTARQDAGTYNSHWNGQNDQGQKVSNGIYLICLKTNQKSQTIKSILIK